MFKKIIHEAVNDAGFDLVHNTENTDFFIKEKGGAERYLIVNILDQLLSVENIHELINASIPEAMHKQPAFKKNCDLILIYKVDFLSDFNLIEEKILEIEENPYYFKKYFFYYSEAEERLLLERVMRTLKVKLRKWMSLMSIKKILLSHHFIV